MELLVGQAGGAPGGADAAQCLLPAGPPAGVPAADVLPGDAELVSALDLGAAGGKQCAGLQTDAFERLAVTKPWCCGGRPVGRGAAAAADAPAAASLRLSGGCCLLRQ